MIPRYSHPEITEIFSDENKLKCWQQAELAVIQAKEILGIYPVGTAEKVKLILSQAPFDINWWLQQDEKIHHDLNAFIDERVRNLDIDLQQYFHQGMTSFDTEEPANSLMLDSACAIIEQRAEKTLQILKNLALNLRYLVVVGRTHGQAAELQSLGAHFLSRYQEVKIALQAFKSARQNLKLSKISGAIGKYGSISPQIEAAALEILGLKPFVGATQIMPRILYAPLAQSLSNLVSVLDEIALDIRLSARSGRPIMQEPFKKKQKGSSAMPHKKNTIRTEQNEGLARLARAYMSAISENIRTWEARAIEQSSVERVAWLDLFQVTLQAIKVLNRVLENLTVYPDNMLEEIYLLRGTYASGEAKDFLKEHLGQQGLGHEDAYRIVQLACFNVFEPEPARQAIRTYIPHDYVEVEILLRDRVPFLKQQVISIQDFIPRGELRVSDELDITEEQVAAYNKALAKLFTDNRKITSMWDNLFSVSYLLRNEHYLYEQILKN